MFLLLIYVQKYWDSTQKLSVQYSIHSVFSQKLTIHSVKNIECNWYADNMEASEWILVGL